MDSLFDIANILLGKHYHFAKTMPQHPHWYTRRREWGNDEPQFERVVQYIRDHGYDETFKGRAYKMLAINGYKYWTMGAPLNETILINRTVLMSNSNLGADYTRIAQEYDDLFVDTQSLEENEHVFGMVELRGRTLDIGCGTGLLLDYKDIAPMEYMGIDPAYGMLKRLIEKHPSHKGRVLCCPFETFVGADHVGERYDNVVSTFCSFSYVNPRFIKKVDEVWTGKGIVFLMFYKDGYFPETYKRAGIEPSHYPVTAYDLSGYECEEYNNFIIARKPANGKV